MLKLSVVHFQAIMHSVYKLNSNVFSTPNERNASLTRSFMFSFVVFYPGGEPSVSSISIRFLLNISMDGIKTPPADIQMHRDGHLEIRFFCSMSSDRCQLFSKSVDVMLVFILSTHVL